MGGPHDVNIPSCVVGATAYTVQRDVSRPRRWRASRSYMVLHLDFLWIQHGGRVAG